METLEMESKTTTRNVCFYTTGEPFTNLMRNFIHEGSYKKVYQTLEEGGMGKEHIKLFFLYMLEFHGDSRTEEGLTVHPCEQATEDYPEILMTGIRTALSAHRNILQQKEFEKHRKVLDEKKRKYEDELRKCTESQNYKRVSEVAKILEDIDEDDNDYIAPEGFKIYELREAVKEIDDLKFLLKVFSFTEIIGFVWKRILIDAGYGIQTNVGGEKEGDGVILRDGTYVTCGFQQHMYLFPILHELGLVSASEWTNDKSSLHITSGQVGGYCHLHDITEAQLQSLFKFKKHIPEVYGDHEKICEALREYTCEIENHGGKYNNLSFLKKYYSDKINLPEFGKKYFETKNGKVFIRTSPKKSLAGLLNSILVSSEEESKKAVNTIKKEFTKYVGLLPEKFVGVDEPYDNNKIHWFYQEFLEGANGVCHCMDKGDFSYALSENQGDIVAGKKGGLALTDEFHGKLKKIASMLYEDLGEPLQLEFVIHDEKVYIVQLRMLENNPETTANIGRPEDVIYEGITFSKGGGEFDVKDILIVESEAQAEQLIGKKALIVEDKVQFSHILALSKSLKVPSVYGTGKVDLSGYKKVNIRAYNKEGFISKTK